MEDFLNTLPSFVHDYLNKYPINALSLLKELVCFAVLYSNDRDIICLLTEQLLREEKSVGVPELTNALENLFLQEERISTQEEEKNNELKMKQIRDKKKEVDHMIVSEKPPSNLASLRILWHDYPKELESQISIPKMSSYHEMSYDNLASHNTSDKYWKPKKKPRSKSPVLINSNNSSTNTSQRSSSVTLSDSPTPISPISPLSLKPISFKKPTSPPLLLRKSMSETTGGRFTLQRPGSTFTVQSRIDHAQRRQKELERKKLLAMMPLESSISKRLKQRVNSGVDWKAIKNQGKLALDSKKKSIDGSYISFLN
ncbi:hypothetical protein K501DRAFT_334824 [Backusella circina FSU 941]|nr:hypothetical protein K501DRAFT_334824 [Backusella circina FSU 941]